MGATNAGVEIDSVAEYPGSDAHRFEYDQERTSASTAVVAAVSDVMGVDPIEMRPLHDTVDCMALDELVRVRPSTTGDVHVSMTHEEHTVTVHSYGVVAVASPGDEPVDERTDELGDHRNEGCLEQ